MPTGRASIRISRGLFCRSCEAFEETCHGFADRTLMEPAGGRGLPRIGLVATDAMRVAGLQAILAEEGEVVVLSARDALDASYELVLIDAAATEHLVELLGLFRQARPQVALIVLGAETDFASIERVIGAGAKGYLSHAVSEAELKMAVGVVRDGSVWAPRKVMARLLGSSLAGSAEAPRSMVRFTRREVEVLRLLVQGQGNREIAETLGVDEGTVKAHMGRLMRKAGVDNRTALSVRTLEHGWV